MAQAKKAVAPKKKPAAAAKKAAKASPKKPKKAAAKKKFDVYPSAYANIWASKYCKGKVGRKKLKSGGLAKKGMGCAIR